MDLMRPIDGDRDVRREGEGRIRGTRFPALRVMAMIMRIATWVAILPLGLAAAVGFWQDTTRPIAIGFAVTAVLFWVVGMIVPELIKVLLSMEASLHTIARASVRVPVLTSLGENAADG